MPPAKRSLPKPPKVEKIIQTNSLVSYCSTCENKGDEIYQMVYLCNNGVNSPKGNHSIINCLKYKK